LRNEGVPESKILQVGDVMYDVALYHGSRVNEEGGAISRLGLLPREYILATIHRAENTDTPERIEKILSGLKEVASQMKPIVWPVHPRTRKTLAKLGILENLGDSI